MIRRPPRPTLFPSTALFRSDQQLITRSAARRVLQCARPPLPSAQPTRGRHARRAPPRLRAHPDRSEEHTSELQSRQYLVCRLLLEKKKHTLISPAPHVPTVI